MTKLIRPFLLLLFMSLAPALRAQVEVYPYAGKVWSKEASMFSPGQLDVINEPSNWIFGAEVLVGNKKLAPLASLAYMSEAVTIDFDPELIDIGLPQPIPGRGNRLLPQLGLAYRLRQPDASLNLLLIATGVVDVPLNDTEGPYTAEESVTILPRLGAKLTLDFIVIGLDYYADFRKDEAYGNQYPSRLALTLGGRF